MSKIKNFNTFLLVYFIFLSINYAIFNFRFVDRFNPYIAADWLINYSGGFVRRGLFGEVLLYLSNFTKISTLDLTIFFPIFFYVAFLYLLFNLLKNKERNFIFLFLLFSPATLLFSFYDPMAVGRKEVIILLFFSIYFIYIKKIRSNLFFTTIYFLLINILVFVHEMVVFYFIYLIIFTYIYNKRFNHFINIKIDLLFFFTSIIFTFFVLHFTNTHDSQILCQNISINIGDVSKSICNGTINDYGEKQQFNLIFDYFKNHNYENYFYYSLLFFIPGSILLYNKTKKNYLKNLLILFFLPIIFTLPILLFVNDWGRYLNIHFILVTVIFASIFLDDRNYLNNKINIRNPLLIMVLLIYSLSWHMPHCCYNKFGSGIYYFYERINFRINDTSGESTKYGEDNLRNLAIRYLKFFF